MQCPKCKSELKKVGNITYGCDKCIKNFVIKDGKLTERK